MSTAALERTAGSLQRRERTVCIVSPNEADYSQTFVRNHISRLPARVVPLYGGPISGSALGTGIWNRLVGGVIRGDFYPNRTRDGQRLVSMAGKVLDLAISRFAGTPAPPLWHRGFRRFLAREGVEAVLAEFVWSGVCAVRACAESGVPLLVHFHGADAYKRSWLDRYLDLYREIFRVAAVLIVVSTDMRRQLLHLGAPEEKVVCNPCGVDVNCFSGAEPAKAPPVFLVIGRMVPKKGPSLALQAFHQVVSRNPDARMVFIGDGELLDECQSLASSSGIGHAVNFKGVCSPKEVVAAVRGARALVQHSIRAEDGDSEGTPLSVLEAGAAGIPVVATRHAGIADVVLDGETGLLVDEGDVVGMARHMMKLIDSPDTAAQLGERAREHISSHYSMEISISNLMSIIDAAIASRGRCSYD